MSSIPSIYRITLEQQRLNEALFEAEGELTPELESALAINEANLTTKTEDYVSSMAQFEAMEKTAEEEIKRLQALAKRSKNARERMKTAISTAMETFGIDRLEVGTHRLSFRKSEAVVIEDSLAIPADNIIVETKVNKAQIKADLKAGKPIAGAMLESRRNLQIR